ncbi:MAG: hypothetical protein HW402_488 [Dehalococcoidales bacterium]|nr:hypothetical protein [Dehalococcoidales bacterium]
MSISPTILELQIEMSKTDSLILEYIYLAIASGILGVIITFVVIFACQYFGIDITKNLWVLAIPVTLAVSLNVCFIELYHKYKKKKPGD